MKRLSAASLIIIVLAAAFSAAANAFNITQILAKHPEFSTFNHYLTVTHLAGEINRRMTITVCAVDNAGMASLLDKHFTLSTIKNILSLHVFSDYFGSQKLHQLNKGTTLTSTIYQATGDAPGTAGFVNITTLKGGKVGFAPEDNDGHFTSTYVKSISDDPYKIAVLQISHPIISDAAEAPAAGPSDVNITTLLTKQGCKEFADLLKSSGAEETFAASAQSGLTVFCPDDKSVRGFMPKYKNLTKEHKLWLLYFHGVPIYHSLEMLKSNNGVMNTLATEGSNKYDFTVKNDGDTVNLDTAVVVATVTGTVYDQEPLAVFKVDKVLQPRKLFKAVAEEAPAPKGSKGKKKKSADGGKKSGGGEDDAESPGPSSDDDESADDTASDNKNGASAFVGGWIARVLLGVCLASFVIIS
nr:fasciclin-like arabinogalactan protein 6 [Cuscuta campestris]